MTNYERLVAQIKRHEGFRRTPYQCSAGTWTVGYGHTMWVDLEMNVSPEWAAIILEEYDLPRADDDLFEVDKAKGAGFWDDWLMDEVEDARLFALVNMAFNLGRRRLAGFRKMWNALKQRDYAAAADEMLDSKWAKQVGDRAVELAEQMRTGKWRDK